MKKLFVFVTVLGLVLRDFAFAADDGFARISEEVLKTKMDKGQDIILLDVRTGRSYDGSNVKIKGAMRTSPDEVETRYKELAKDKEIVTYCT